jgi:hypothetical protein
MPGPTSQTGRTRFYLIKISIYVLFVARDVRARDPRATPRDLGMLAGVASSCTTADHAKAKELHVDVVDFFSIFILSGFCKNIWLVRF